MSGNSTTWMTSSERCAKSNAQAVIALLAAGPADAIEAVEHDGKVTIVVPCLSGGPPDFITLEDPSLIEELFHTLGGHAKLSQLQGDASESMPPPAALEVLGETREEEGA